MGVTAIKRRDFLKLGTVAAVAPALGAMASPAVGALPDWANAQIDEAVARYKAWKGTDEAVAFTFMTDVHSYLTEIPATPNFANSRYHVLFAQEAAVRAGCDFLVDGGDHDYDNICKSDEEALKRMAVAEHVCKDFAKLPVLFCLGNHDHGPFLGRKTPPISSERFGDVFNGMAERHGHKLVFGENKSWGYYDVPNKKFRAIYCNTSDDGYYGLSQSQIDFLKTALETLPEGWKAVAFGHYCVFNEIGHWKSYQGGADIRRKKEFMETLEAFAKRRPKDLVGYFCGDSHFDNEMEFRGVNWTISQGYGGVGPADKPWGARTIPFSRAKSMLFELVGVKPVVGEFRVFRVGAGGAAFDRTCLYFNK